MKYLVDANVLSEVTKPSPEPRVIEWLRVNQADLAVDPVILGELRFGILILPDGRKRRTLEGWFEAVSRRILCLAWEADTALRWAQLLADLRAKGKAMPVKDSLIAATAITRGLTVVTRNGGDFAHAGLAIIDPFRG